MTLGRLVGVLLLVGAVGTAVALAVGWLRVPPAWDPFAPLDVKAAPNLVTGIKLMRLEHDPQACFAALASADLDHVRLPDRRSGNGCDLIDTVRVTGSDVAFQRSFIATCPLAVSVAMLERHALQPAAERHFGQPVKRIEHLGSFACRNVYGRERGRRSEHATANALDVSAFVLRDGTRVAVERGWTAEGPAAAFLRDVRDGACSYFDTVLSPDYNAAHRNHLDMGPFQACR